MRRSVLFAAGFGVLGLWGCGQRGSSPEPAPAPERPAETATSATGAEVSPPLSEPYADPTLGVNLELPAGWSEAASEDADDDYAVTFKKDGAVGPVVRLQAVPKGDYLEIQKMLEIEKQPAAARVKAVAREMSTSLAENKTEPEIVSDEVWTTTGIIAGRRVIAKQTDATTGANEGQVLVGESAGGGLYILLCTTALSDDAGRTQVKELLDSLAVTEPSIVPPTAQGPGPSMPKTKDADQPMGADADGVDAGAGTDAAR